MKYISYFWALFKAHLFCLFHRGWRVSTCYTISCQNILDGKRIFKKEIYVSNGKYWDTEERIWFYPKKEDKNEQH